MARKRDVWGPPGFAEFVRDKGCIVGKDCFGRIEAAHVKSRGAGGDALGNLVGLCSLHHSQQHILGIITFQDRHGIDMTEKAKALHRAWSEEWI